MTERLPGRIVRALPVDVGRGDPGISILCLDTLALTFDGTLGRAEMPIQP